MSFHFLGFMPLIFLLQTLKPYRVVQGRGESVNTKWLVQVADQEPNGPEQLESEADQNVECDTGQPNGQKLQIDEARRAKALLSLNNKKINEKTWDKQTQSHQRRAARHATSLLQWNA